MSLNLTELNAQPTETIYIYTHKHTLAIYLAYEHRNNGTFIWYVLGILYVCVRVANMLHAGNSICAVLAVWDSGVCVSRKFVCYGDYTLHKQANKACNV